MSLTNTTFPFANTNYLFLSATHELYNNSEESVDQTHDFYSTEARVIQIVPKPIGYVLGEQLRNLFDFFYSRMPTFSLPGAAASPTAPCTDSLKNLCEHPKGSYLGSCHNSTVTYLPKENTCLLQTKCSTIFAGLEPQFNELKFSPEDSLVLGNRNGTLTILEASKIHHLSPEEANEKLSQNFEEIKDIEKMLSDPAINELLHETLLRQKEALLRNQGQIIGKLSAGDIITLDLNKNRQPGAITPENKASHAHLFNREALDCFQRLASSTNGIMGQSPFSEHLPRVIERIFDHLLHTLNPNESIDIAFVLDSTDSMTSDIEQVKTNLVNFLEQVKSRKSENGNRFRYALVEYRDKDSFLNRINIDFTSDANKLEKSIKTIITSGGGDTPEAVFDALLTTKNDLSWDPNAKHIVILIADAPPHPTTIDNLHNEKDVIQQYNAEGIEIVVYPIIV